MKTFYQQDNIGKAKYTISAYNGIDTHKDGSPFYGIAIFKNKSDLQAYRQRLLSDGYKETDGYKER
jgi:hypothetical protein